jgi:hypothetical protein
MEYVIFEVSRPAKNYFFVMLSSPTDGSSEYLLDEYSEMRISSINTPTSLNAQQSGSE